MRSKILLRIAPPVLLLIHAGLLAYGAAVHSPCIDEVGHMAAGLSHWQLGRFDLYHVNPPLVRMVAVTPVLFAEPKTDWSQYSDAPGARSEFAIGRDFITVNGERSFWFFTWARWACIPFSLLGGYICFRWARELYGDWSGLLALTLWCFEPNILAHGQLITPDMGATALGLTAAYVFWKWLKRPGWMLALAAGLALGLALLTKGTWIILFGLWPALWILGQARSASGGRQPPDFAMNQGANPPRSPRPPRTWPRQLLQLGTMFLLAVYILNAAYGFEGSLTRLGDYRFVSNALGGEASPGVSIGRNRFTGTWLAAVPMPIPKNFLEGIDVQKRDFESHFNSYLRGEWRKEGWWYYYIYAMIVKVPLGIWTLALLAALFALLRRGYAASWRDELTVLAPAAVVLTLVSAETGFNHHLRYVLPVFPFCIVSMSKAARAPASRERQRPVWARLPALLAAGAAASAVISSLLVYPHSLSYFNEMAGGPANGSAHLVDSNIDWGQDLFYLRDWLNEHPQARPLHLAYFGSCDPRLERIEFTPPPRGPDPGDAGADRLECGPRPGWYAVSVTLLGGRDYSIPDGRGGMCSSPLEAYRYFQRFRPVARAGWSIYIYHITPEECAQTRETMGLPPLLGVEPPPGRKD